MTSQFIQKRNEIFFCILLAKIILYFGNSIASSLVVFILFSTQKNIYKYKTNIKMILQRHNMAYSFIFLWLFFLPIFLFLFIAKISIEKQQKKLSEEKCKLTCFLPLTIFFSGVYKKWKDFSLIHIVKKLRKKFMFLLFHNFHLLLNSILSF